MAQRKAVLVPEEAGCVKAIGDGDFGFICRPSNLEDLIGKTLAALGDTQRNLHSRHRVLSEYD